VKFNYIKKEYAGHYYTRYVVSNRLGLEERILVSHGCRILLVSSQLKGFRCMFADYCALLIKERFVQSFGIAAPAIRLMVTGYWDECGSAP